MRKSTAKAAASTVYVRRSNAERAAATRAQIIDASISILVDKGFAALSNALITQHANVSSGALMHHFPARADLLKQLVEIAYTRLSELREQELDKLERGLPRFRAIIDLAWMTSRTPEGVAVNEVRSGARSDPQIAKATRQILSFIADDYARFVGRLARQAGLEPTAELRGLSAATAMSVRSLAIGRSTYVRDQLDENVLLALRTLREDIIARQLGARKRIDPGLTNLA